MMGLWTAKWAAMIEPESFRGHNQYLEQSDSYPYEAMVTYLESRGTSGWLDAMGEDGAFGCVTRVVCGRTVSRDLLDSVMEIETLVSRFGIDLRYASVLDIGAGYGRLAHRMATAFPEARVFCTDAIPVSLDVCRRYLAHRSVQPRVYAADELGQLPPIDLAVNIHSWSECTRAEILPWLV